MRFRTVATILAFTVLALGLIGNPARAQDEKAVLRAMPPDALGFVVINKLDQSSDKVQGVAKKLGLPPPFQFSPLDLAKKGLGITKGINVKGSAAAALFLGDEGEPPIGVA